MPRYFFHVSHGKRTFTDSTGIELAGIASARSHATIQIRDMKATLQDWAGWKMIVVDVKGKIVFEANFDLTLRSR
jgi:hypothetical protein